VVGSAVSQLPLPPPFWDLPPPHPPPPQIVEYATSKTGKHGHAKARYAAQDIFTGKRFEDAQPTDQRVEVPVGTSLTGQ
jgi:translation elongation factor P/translation initiation factor 5A